GSEIAMTIRWKKIAPIFAVVTAIGLFPLLYERISPDHFSGVACVRSYSDGRVEKDMGDSCYDPTLPEAIVLKRKK
ncbi:MAG: hypothetical protein DCF15_21050, partial [Phormidesmis priestleyi]